MEAANIWESCNEQWSKPKADMNHEILVGNQDLD